MIRELRDSGRGTTLVIIAAGWFLSIGVRMMYPALLPYIREAYGLNLTTAGFLLTVLWFAYAVGQLPGGLFADHFGEGTIMTVSTLLAAIALTVVVISRTADILFVATALFGFGTALYGIARFTALADIFPDHVGAATGVTMAAGDAGNSVLPPLAVLVAAHIAWQFGFGIMVPLFLLVALGFLVAVPSRTSDPTADIGLMSFGGVRRVVEELWQPSIVQSTLLLVVGSCIWQSVTGFYPTYLVEVKGMSTTVAAAMFGLFFVLGVAIKPLAGGAYDRVGVRRSLVSIISVIVVALSLLPFAQGFWPLFGVTMLVSSLLGYATIVLSYMTATLSESVRGVGLGTLRTIYTMIAATSPMVFGAIADRGFFDEGFFLLAALAVVMLFIAVRLPEQSEENSSLRSQ